MFCHYLPLTPLFVFQKKLFPKKAKKKSQEKKRGPEGHPTCFKSSINVLIL
jgi:hypothetical protein